MGLALGPVLSETLGPFLGDELGAFVGNVLGLLLGEALGISLGDALGVALGRCAGRFTRTITRCKPWSSTRDSTGRCTWAYAMALAREVVSLYLELDEEATD
jgi:hypothetical protein